MRSFLRWLARAGKNELRNSRPSFGIKEYKSRVQRTSVRCPAVNCFSSLFDRSPSPLDRTKKRLRLIEKKSKKNTNLN